ncbi:hypothetical protein BT96DRAFT_888188 [Gymnopus androsaceus JB14]|uniref:Protein kinase domain-containing protein n=1 Tax=Gymnopus androsaceus JB14 TaxID=1447944 RepID=A0A6A4H1X6_9AGAR|nr:hypothetical protein BT96DRAFT_888188 [Gymnopus androsaceus JB14]
MKLDSRIGELETLKELLTEFVEPQSKHRVVQISVQERLFPIQDLKGPKEYAQVLYDVFQCHRWLYEHAHILHRDISVGNIMFRKHRSRIYGVLNDFDLACKLSEITSDPLVDHRLGTKPFMALDVLAPTWTGGKKALYRHDLESLFYTILCIACQYNGTKLEPKTSPFQSWFEGSLAQVYQFKTNDILLEDTWYAPVTGRFIQFVPWLEDMRKLVRVGYLSRPTVANTDYARQFNYDTLGGVVSHRTFRAIMSRFNRATLEERSSA